MRESYQIGKPVTLAPLVAISSAATVTTGNTISGAGGATNGGIDTRGFCRLIAIAAIGASTATQSISWKLQQSSDEAAADAYTDISGAAGTALTDADDNKCAVIDLNLNGCERYIRVSYTSANTGATTFGVIGYLCDPVVAPTSHIVTAVAVNT